MHSRAMGSFLRTSNTGSGNKASSIGSIDQTLPNTLDNWSAGSKDVPQIEDAAKEEANWEGLLPGFSEERAMSDYIASFPQRLESGLRPHPAFKVREIVLDDGRRLDVLLIDSNGVPVVVECKQGVPAVEHIKQLRHYMQKVGSIKRLSASKPRGILVHGGSRKLPEDVQRESQRKPTVELVQYSVAVSFARCS